ncbi:succinate--hydroxymethylglutarate CoA-transferase [Trichonephila clavipes]|nr:succinate--hydroxymethylglutarate CoA-transferase [Trichonephila clavipes]
MSQQRDLQESMAWRVIGRLESGQTQRRVANAVGVARSVVERLWNRFQETGNIRCRPEAGRPRATTSTDDRYIQLTARRNRTENATQLQRQLLLATGRRVSSQTVDESRFSLECDTRRVLVWRDRGTRNNPAFVRERSQYRRAGWMVWGGISIGGRTDLHIIRNGTLTGRRYADKILRPHVIPYGGAIGDSFVFQDDNARPHRARLVENMLEAETIQRMEWQACSPDLNPIEHVWDILGRRIAARPRPPATVRDLEIALLEEWNSIPQSLIDNLIASMAKQLGRGMIFRHSSFSKQSTQHWINKLEGCDIPFGPVNEMEQVFVDPQIIHNKMVIDMVHSVAGHIKMTGPAVKYSDSNNQGRLPSPYLAEHTDVILSSILSYSKDKIRSLRDSRVIS